MNPNTLLRCSIVAALAAAVPGASAAEIAPGVRRLFDLTPERVEAFRRTMRDFGPDLWSEEAAASGISLEARYVSPIVRARSDDRHLAEDLRVAFGSGRDPVRDEIFLITGREDDYEDAATRWLSRSLKGSGGASSSGGARVAPKFGWDDGPVAGLRAGPISATLGEHEWRIRFTRKLRALPGWSARVSLGVEDGEEKIAFVVGRSLLQSRSR